VALQAIDKSAANVEQPISLDDHERKIIAAALGRTRGNQSKAAATLKIGRDRLRYKMAKYKLK
jgi:DNA-binding NtrC family response regulator